jgi:dolichol kinase
MWPEIKRKLFHFSALIYILGVLFLERVLFIKILIALLIVTGLFEILRLRNSTVRTWFLNSFGGLIREKEKQSFSGVFWMMLGVLSACLILREQEMIITALLYLILGDGVASLAGKKIGGPHWPMSSKRLSGSLACFLVCLLIGFVMLPPSFAGMGYVWGAVAATVFELGFIPLNDNFLIPFMSSWTLLICYHLRPFFI